MIDFSIGALMDEAARLQWMERHLYPASLCCPRCGSWSYRLFRPTHAFPGYRCHDCDGAFTILTGTAVEKNRQKPSTVVLFLRGVAQGETTTRLSRELSLSYKHALMLRHRVQNHVHETTPVDLIPFRQEHPACSCHAYDGRGYSYTTSFLPAAAWKKRFLSRCRRRNGSAYDPDRVRPFMKKEKTNQRMRKVSVKLVSWVARILRRMKSRNMRGNESDRHPCPDDLPRRRANRQPGLASPASPASLAMPCIAAQRPCMASITLVAGQCMALRATLVVAPTIVAGLCEAMPAMFAVTRRDPL